MEWLSIIFNDLLVPTALIVLFLFYKFYLPDRFKEELKSKILNKDKLLGKKREVYQDIVLSLTVFIAGRNNSQQQEDFLEAYSKAWLWAPEKVLKPLNEYIDCFQERENESDRETKYRSLIAAMREDIGLLRTKQKFQFVSFKKNKGTFKDVEKASD